MRRKIDEQRAIFNAITKSWLDDKFATFGRWTFRAFVAIIFIIFLRAILHINMSDLRSLLESTVQIQDIGR